MRYFFHPLSKAPMRSEILFFAYFLVQMQAKNMHSCRPEDGSKVCSACSA